MPTGVARLKPSRETATVVVSAFALVISLISLFAANMPADIRMLMATQVHLSVGPHADIYLQPVFLSTATNDRAEVVDDVTATMTVTGDPSVYELIWSESGTWDIGPYPSYSVTWKVIDANPEPILITPASPQTPTLRFHPARNFTWVPGTYRIELRANRLVESQPLKTALAFDLDQADVARIEREGEFRFSTFPARREP